MMLAVFLPWSAHSYKFDDDVDEDDDDDDVHVGVGFENIILLLLFFGPWGNFVTLSLLSGTSDSP